MEVYRVSTLETLVNFYQITRLFVIVMAQCKNTDIPNLSVEKYNRMLCERLLVSVLYYSIQAIAVHESFGCNWNYQVKVKYTVLYFKLHVS
jgi:hypothetical protein